MNPLTSILGTIISGFVLAIIIVFALGPTGVNPIEIAVWAHVLVGITWIGLLYYFNFGNDHFRLCAGNYYRGCPGSDRCQPD